MRHAFDLKRSIKSAWLICGLFILCEACCIWRMAPAGKVFPNKNVRTYYHSYSKELLSFQTFAEEKIGKEIAKRAKLCMEYTGAEEVAPDAGALSCFYWFSSYEKPDHVTAEVKFNKAAIHGFSGGVWLTYSMDRFDENDKLISGCRESLVRCEIRKDESGSWNVTDVLEMP